MHVNKSELVVRKLIFLINGVGGGRGVGGIRHGVELLEEKVTACSVVDAKGRSKEVDLELETEG